MALASNDWWRLRAITFSLRSSYFWSLADLASRIMLGATNLGLWLIQAQLHYAPSPRMLLWGRAFAENNCNFLDVSREVSGVVSLKTQAVGFDSNSAFLCFFRVRWRVFNFSIMFLLLRLMSLVHPIVDAYRRVPVCILSSFHFWETEVSTSPCFKLIHPCITLIHRHRLHSSNTQMNFVHKSMLSMIRFSITTFPFLTVCFVLVKTFGVIASFSLHSLDFA